MSNDLQTIRQAPVAYDFFSQLERAMRAAELIAKSDMIPKHFQGKPANVLLVIEHAARVGLAPMMMLQECYVVHGNLSHSGKLVKAMIDASGLYSSTSYVIETRDGKAYCRLQAVRARDGVIVDGPVVDVEALKRRHKNKWDEIPDMMMRYRAAAYFMRSECPGVGLGLLTEDESEEIVQDAPRETRRAQLLAPIPQALPAATTQRAEPAPVVDVSPVSEPAAARVEAPAPVAKAREPEPTKPEPVDMLRILPESIDGLDPHVYRVACERAQSSILGVDTDGSKALLSLYTYVTDPEAWARQARCEATPGSLERSLTKRLGMDS